MSAWNVANLVTVLRIAMVPVFVVLMLAEDGTHTGWRLAAAVVFVLAAATDRVDGALARRHGLITDFGKIADPIADKALVGAGLVTLSLLGELSWWVTAVIGIREIGVTVLRFWVIRHGVIPASRGGKLKTVLQLVAIVLLVLPLGAGWDVVAGVAVGAAVVVTVLTGLDYVVRALSLRSASTRTTPTR